MAGSRAHDKADRPGTGSGAAKSSGGTKRKRPQPRRTVPKRGGATAADDVLALQRTIGNQGVVRMLGEQNALQRDTAAPTQDEAVPQVELYPIWNQLQRKETMVNSDQYELERTHLGNLLRYLAKAIPEDAKDVLSGYPFGEVKEMYQDALDNLTAAGQHYAKGELVKARQRAHAAGEYTGIEVKAHKILLDKGMMAYVAEHVGAAVIGFFEGAAEAMVGLIDTGAGLIGFHPDLEGKIKARYDIINEAYSGATGLDSTLTNDRAIGRLGGKVAENLATFKVMKGAGVAGEVAQIGLGLAGTKSAVETIVAMRKAGKSWGDILTDPVALTQVAAGLAGLAGAGGAGPVGAEVRSFLQSAGVVLNGAQIATLTAAIVTYQDDPNLSAQENADKRADLVANALTAIGTTVAEHAGPGPESPGAAGETTESTGTTESTPDTANETGPQPAPVTGETAVGEVATEPDPPGAITAGQAAEAVRSSAIEENSSRLEEPARQQSEAEPAATAAFDPATAGLRPEVAATLQAVAGQLDVVIEVRPVNLESVPHLEAGALAKMSLIKAKTITELDSYIGAPANGRGLVGLFEPTEPVFAAEVSPELRAAVQKRYAQRLAEWNGREAAYGKYVEKGLVQYRDGLLQVVDPTAAGEAGQGRFKPVAGDVDLFDIRHSDGTALTAVERDAVQAMLQSMDIGIEHGAHQWWEAQSQEESKNIAFDKPVHQGIVDQHMPGQDGSTPLVAFSPGGEPRQVWASDRPTGVPRTDAQFTPEGDRAMGALADLGVQEPGAADPNADYVDIGADLNEPGGQSFADEVDTSTGVAPNEHLADLALPAGTMVQDRVPTDAAAHWDIYQRMIAEDTGREAALFYNPVSREWLVVQGEKSKIVGQQGEPARPRGGGQAASWKEILDANSDVGRWQMFSHSHPSGRSVPSVQDFMSMLSESASSNGAARSSTIAVTTSDGLKLGGYSYDPSRAEPYRIAPVGETATSFASLEEFRDWSSRELERELDPLPAWVAQREAQLAGEHQR